MPTNWITPDINTINAILTAVAMKTADEKIVANTQRSTIVLGFEVNRFREAIQLAGISPLSVTLGSIPPGSEKHCAVLAMQTLISSIPQLAAYIVGTPGAGKTGLARMIEDAEEWLMLVRKGRPVVPPSDPTGQDYLTAVSANNPAILAIEWGDAYGTSGDYANGFVTNPDGSQTPLLPLDMNLHI